MSYQQKIFIVGRNYDGSIYRLLKIDRASDLNIVCDESIVFYWVV